MKKLLALFIFFVCISTRAQVKLPRLVGDNMVLQRDMPIPVWGWAQKGEKITIKISNVTASTTTATNGKWMLKLQALPAGGPFEMIIKGKNTITLKNIMVGDVWLCAGEINMEYPIARYSYAGQEIDQANFHNLRLFNVHTDMGAKPKDDLLSGYWVPAIKENIGDFSALAYFFGRDLHAKLNIPIGLISSTWGGTPAESWMSAEAIKKFPEFNSLMEEVKSNKPLLTQGEKYDIEKARLEQERKMKIASAMDQPDPGLKNGKPAWNESFFTASDWVNTILPGRWEEKDIPNYDGTVWYRKEFTLSENIDTKGLVLNLGPIDDMDYAYVNGTLVGSAYMYNAPREYKLPANLLKPGKNEVVVRVIDLGGGGGFWANPAQMGIQNSADKKYIVALDGSWQYKKAFHHSEAWEKNLGIEPVFLTAGNGGKYTSYAYPNLMFNGMIKPLIPYGIKGVIWSQGESSVGKAQEYQTLFPALIGDWRTQWGQGDFPFLFVQLANFMKPTLPVQQSDWAELREAQTKALSLPNTGMAVATDLGSETELAFENKQLLGKRLSILARKIAYGETSLEESPAFQSMEREGNKIRIKFKPSGSQLISLSKYGYIKGFAIAGEDKKFVPAKAAIENNTVIVSCESIKSPVAVRYAWADNPSEANLYNKAGYPAAPFRTDSWGELTK